MDVEEIPQACSSSEDSHTHSWCPTNAQQQILGIEVCNRFVRCCDPFEKIEDTAPAGVCQDDYTFALTTHGRMDSDAMRMEQWEADIISTPDSMQIMQRVNVCPGLHEVGVDILKQGCEAFNVFSREISKHGVQIKTGPVPLGATVWGVDCICDAEELAGVVNPSPLITLIAGKLACWLLKLDILLKCATITPVKVMCSGGECYREGFKKGSDEEEEEEEDAMFVEDLHRIIWMFAVEASPVESLIKMHTFDPEDDPEHTCEDANFVVANSVSTTYASQMASLIQAMSGDEDVVSDKILPIVVFMSSQGAHENGSGPASEAPKRDVSLAKGKKAMALV